MFKTLQAPARAATLDGMPQRDFPAPCDKLLPPTLDVANLALALYHALDACHASMPYSEQWVLRHTMLDPTLQWENMVHELPSLQRAIGKETLGLAAKMPGGLTTSLVAPVLVWGLTQSWVPNQESMLNSVLNKWKRLFVDDGHRTQERGPQEHIHLMRSMMLLLDQLPFDVDPLVYDKVMTHCAAPDYPHGIYKYNDHFSVLWLQWLARLSIRAKKYPLYMAPDEGLDNDKAIDAYNDAYHTWSSIAMKVLSPILIDARQRDGYPLLSREAASANFESMLKCSLPNNVIVHTLGFANVRFWTDPQHTRRLDYLLSQDPHIRILQLPWRTSFNELGDPANFDAHMEQNKALAARFLPALYHAVLAVYPEQVWQERTTLVTTLTTAIPDKRVLRQENVDSNLFLT